MSDPRVSIITPVRATTQQHLAWLHEAIASVADQSEPVEMIVVDDHSTVDLAPVRWQWPSVTWLEAEGNGCAAARNQAVGQANAELILPLDGDDKLTADAVTSFLRTWDSGGSEKGIVYSDVVMFGQDYAKMYVAPGYDFRTLLSATFMVVGCLHRRSDWEKVGGWRVDMEAGLEDWEYWISLGEMGVCGLRVPEALYWYRRHAQGRLARLKQDPTRWQRAYQRMRDLHIQSYNGRFPMGCCGGTNPPGFRPKTRGVPDAPAPEAPTGVRVRILYVGGRAGDFGLVGKATRIRYRVPGRNMLVEDANGKPGVDVRDLPGILAYKGFKRVGEPAPAPAMVAAPPPASVPEVPEAPKAEAPKAAEWKPDVSGGVRKNAIVRRAVQAQRVPTSVPAPKVEAAKDETAAKPKRKYSGKSTAK